MAFRLKNHEPPVAGLVRLFRGEMRAIIRELGRFSRDPADAIHEARKHNKRARAILRLLRPALPVFAKAENAALRDLGRALAPFRDRDAQRECLDRLASRRLASIRKALATTYSPVGDTEIAKQIAQATATLHRFETLEIPPGDFLIVANGIVSTYRKARRAMRAANQGQEGEDFHEWRKRTKDLAYQIQLLRKLWPKPLKALHAELDDLGELLGENQDLTILSTAVGEMAVSASDLAAFQGLADSERRQLHDESFRMGRLLLAEKPESFGRRLRKYWQAARED